MGVTLRFKIQTKQNMSRYKDTTSENVSYFLYFLVCNMHHMRKLKPATNEILVMNSGQYLIVEKNIKVVLSSKYVYTR